jgi:prevent-host-death family protein
MADRIIPQRELRNNVGKILREAEDGAVFTITVRGRAVARLGPTAELARQVNVPTANVRAQLAATPVDQDYAADVARLRELEAPVEDAWRGK